MIDQDLLRKLFPEKLKAGVWAKYIDEKPVPYKPIITQEDVDNKFVVRYFIRLANTKDGIVEIDKKQYDILKKNPRYITTELKWKIVGRKETEITSSNIINRGTKDYNLQQVSNADITFRGLLKYIRNFEEYWVSET